MRADDLRRGLRELADDERVTVETRAVMRRGRRRLVWRRVPIAVGAVALVIAAVGLGTRGLGTRRVQVVGSTNAATTSAPVAPQPSTSSTSSTTLGTTTSPAPTTSTTQSGVPLQSVAWASVDYPMTPDCGSGFTPPTSVGPVAYPVPAAGVQLAVVLVRCTVGAGTPPVSLFVYDGATTAMSPHLAETLVTDRDGWQAGTFRVDGASISMPVFGFSSESVPNCCPDISATLVWDWNGSSYARVSR